MLYGITTLLLSISIGSSTLVAQPQETQFDVQNESLQTILVQNTSDQKTKRESLRNDLSQYSGIELREDFDAFFDGSGKNEFSPEYCNGKISASICLTFERDVKKLRWNRYVEKYGNDRGLAKQEVAPNSLANFCEKTPEGGLSCNIPQSMSAEFMAISALEDVVTFTNHRAQELGYSFQISPLELYTLWITEGGYFPIAQNRNINDEGDGQLHGYSDLGLDDFSFANRKIRPYVENWSSPRLIDFVANKARVEMATNEQEASKHSVVNFDVENGLYAFAAMYAPAKAKAEMNLRRTGIDINELPMEKQVAASYLYFNHGLGSTLLGRVMSSMEGSWVPNPRFKNKLYNPVRNAYVRFLYYQYFEAQCQMGGLMDARLCGL